MTRPLTIASLRLHLAKAPVTSYEFKTGQSSLSDALQRVGFLYLSILMDAVKSYHRAFGLSQTNHDRTINAGQIGSHDLEIR